MSPFGFTNIVDVAAHYCTDSHRYVVVSFFSALFASWDKEDIIEFTGFWPLVEILRNYPKAERSSD